MTALERLIADLQAMPSAHRVLCWSGFDQEPYDGTMFREYLFPRDELLAALTGQPAPPPATIRVKVNASAGLRVRRAPVDGEVMGKLPDGTVIAVFEQQPVKDWYRLSEGMYAGGYVSAVYTEKVT